MADNAVNDDNNAATAERTSSSFKSYREVRATCRDFAARANAIERRANEATRGVKQLMLRQVQLARAIDAVLQHIHHLAEHYKRMDSFADELLLPHNYVLSDRMMNANVEEHYLWLTADFLQDARNGLEEADQLVEAQEYMETRREQVHGAVDNIKRLARANSKLARELEAFAPRAATFFRNLRCGCDPAEACPLHDWEPKGKIAESIRRLDDKTADILASLEALLRRLASDVGKRDASPRGDDNGGEGRLDKCVTGGCAVCGSEAHATAFCPQARAAASEMAAEGASQTDRSGLHLMSGGLQTEGNNEPSGN